MKTLRLTLELVDEQGRTLHSRIHEMRPSEGWPTRTIMLKSNGSGLQHSAIEEARVFWDEVIGMGYLDADYMRPWKTYQVPPMDGGDE